MAGIIDGLLGAGVGAAGAVMNNAMFNRQQQAEQDKENRAMDRETFLMELRSKYNKSEADHSDTLARGRAVHQQQLQLDGLNAKQVIEAEQRKRQDDVNEYDLKKMIDNDYASEKEGRDNKEWGRRNSIEYGQKKGLENMKLSAIQARKGSGGGGAGGDDDSDIGNPDFVKARKDLTGYLGIDLNDRMGVQAARTKLGLAGNSSDNDVGEVLKAATLVYAANPTIDPNEAVKMARDLAYGKIRLTPVPLSNGKTINSFMVNGKRYAYGRPN